MAIAGLAWGSWKAMTDSADLLRRAEEVDLFVRGLDPYVDPDMTYPPTAPPIFAPFIAPFAGRALKSVWLGLNLAALVALGLATLRLGGQGWPGWLKLAFVLVVAASKPVRGGIGLGQFHLIPTALAVGALLAARGKREFLAGLMLGVALAKPTIALPFLAILVARGNGRSLATAIGLQAALLAGVSRWLEVGPRSLIREWIGLARDQVPAGAIDLPSLAHRAWPAAPSAAPAISLVVLTLTLAATVAWRRRSDLTLASLAASAAAIFTYHRFYDLVLLVLPLAFLIETARRRGGAWIAAAAGFAALLIIPEQPIEKIGLGRAYESAFVTLAYLLLGLGILAVAREGEPGDLETR